VLWAVTGAARMRLASTIKMANDVLRMRGYLPCAMPPGGCDLAGGS